MLLIAFANKFMFACFIYHEVRSILSILLNRKLRRAHVVGMSGGWPPFCIAAVFFRAIIFLAVIGYIVQSPVSRLNEVASLGLVLSILSLSIKVIVLACDETVVAIVTEKLDEDSKNSVVFLIETVRTLIDGKE